ncbi:MAG: helix-turn-helix domain-containing protein [Ruminococcus sp.]|nr:helix-turn-helix domain-containing protein [Ruminococcus sp.]
MATFAERLCEAMRVRDVKQHELCQRTKIGKSAMSQYMSGKFEPKQTRTFLIAQALDVSIDWLMGANVPIGTFNPILSHPTSEESIFKLLKAEYSLNDADIDFIRDYIKLAPGEREAYRMAIEAIKKIRDADQRPQSPD